MLIPLIGITGAAALVWLKLKKPAFIMPMAPGTYRLTSPFGVRRDPLPPYKLQVHPGLDFAAAMGTPVLAAADGFVLDSGMLGDGSYGNRVLLTHKNGFVSTYNHMSGVSVRRGATVVAGQQVGLIGSTGKSTGPHLHFEIKKPLLIGKGWTFYDPAELLPGGRGRSVTWKTGDDSVRIDEGRVG
ncbi:MAG: M23 family metallopeptidase [Dehalococcoidia bacterium]|nr:M23 family metallopeptidase [Dehalococcoidia bacterium]